MAQPHSLPLRTPVGPRPADSDGSLLSVVRLAAELSYAGTNALLQTYINDGDEQAWEEIKTKIDYTYDNVAYAMERLNEATGFGQQVTARVARGQKVLFKPNLVSTMNIDPQTHGADAGSTAATEWPFVAALMRWFHDRLGIRYYQMCLGEGSPHTISNAGYYSFRNPEQRRVTGEAAIEGRSGNFYGGWGFYFVRQYLADRLAAGSPEDPRLGFEESVSGTYLPPGRAGNRLMVYDLNEVSDALGNGREVAVANGENYRSITLHKVVVGGDPGDPGDRELYPGCVLVNVPRLKVHSTALFTAAIKNIGIGLYPLHAGGSGDGRWQYGYPHLARPSVKGVLPHERWVAEVDPDTGHPQLDEAGNVVRRRTGGLNATMADVLEAVAQQDVYTIHVVDAIETVNLDHTGPGPRVPEGLAMASLDPVAVDLFCARYLFGNVPMAEAEQVGLEDGFHGHFAQRVPLARPRDGAIVTEYGYDCPIPRDRSLAYAAERGLGGLAYHVVGRDAPSGLPLVSVSGRLGTVEEGAFSELRTECTYYATFKVPWDLQRTILSYLEAVDQLTGSSWRQQFLATFDENGDGVVDYDESGPAATSGPRLNMLGTGTAIRGSAPYGYLSGLFSGAAPVLKYRDSAWNAAGLDLFSQFTFHTACATALQMSTAASEAPDLFEPGLTWGRGKWPGFRTANFVALGRALYGPAFPTKAGLGGLLGLAFRYADAVQNAGRYCGAILSRPEPQAFDRYVADVRSRAVAPLAFTMFVPQGFGTVGGEQVPNVEETTEPARVFTARFGGGETWPLAIEEVRRLCPGQG
ncbi:MAG: DUF362 domain-containing protein [Chloroflexota bacterium]